MTRNGSIAPLFGVPAGMQLVQDVKDGRSVWVSDFGSSSIKRCSFGGALLSSYNTSSTTPMDYVRGLAQCPGPDYDLLVSDSANRRLVRMSRDDGRLVSVFNVSQPGGAGRGMGYHHRLVSARVHYPLLLHPPAHPLSHLLLADGEDGAAAAGARVSRSTRSLTPGSNCSRSTNTASCTPSTSTPTESCGGSRQSLR